MSLWETLTVTSGTDVQATPGAVLRALTLGGGIAAGTVGTMTPMGPGRTAVEIAVTAARRLSTPRPLPSPDGAAWMLTRPDDPPAPTAAWITIRGPKAGSLTPGALAGALAAATEGTWGSEDIGVGYAGKGWTRVAVSPGLVWSGQLPATLTIAGADLQLTADL